MHFSLNHHFRGITVFIICIFEIRLVLCSENEALQPKISNLSERQFDTGNSTNNNLEYLLPNKIQTTTESDNFNRGNATVKDEIKASTKRLKKRKRGKRKKNRRKTNGLTTTTEFPIFQSDGNQTLPKPSTKKKRRRKLKRRKNRKNRRKQKIESSNILEITTAKEMVFSTNTDTNSTINELIRKLNENPEDNFEEFRLKKDSATNKIKKKNVANLVAPAPVNSKFTPAIHDNITLHVNIDNGTNLKIPTKSYNRCRKKKGGCAHFCNPKGKTKCSCFKGFALASDGKTCLDIDECKISNGECEKECHNTLGSYECRCPTGLRLSDDMKSCEDINECLLRNGHGLCQDTCENTFGSFKCSCAGLNGTVLGENGCSCVDTDECASNNAGCSHNCINTLGTAFCSCPSGMELSSDWKTCQDINECEDESIREFCKNCVNTERSYLCYDTADFQSDQPSPKTTCKPLPLPSSGYLNCSRDNAIPSYSERGRKRIKNTAGTICKLICPIGYKLAGEFFVICNTSGKWEGKTNAKCVGFKPPIISCPPNQHFKADAASGKATVKFHSPRVNINWKYVKSYPAWAKDLTASLKVGLYDVNFLARDPDSKLYASCNFKVIVDN